MFAQWQAEYAAVGIPTFPVAGKAPLIRGYLRLGLEGSRKLVERHADAAALGFSLRRAGIVVVDVDTPDANVLADALRRYGSTPVVVRTGGGNLQAWYRGRNEPRLIRPDPELPIDLLGDGFVVAPPSLGARGRYEIVQGSLADLARLPPLLRAPVATRPRRSVGEGKRNDTLWRACMAQAKFCDDFDALLDVARSINDDFSPPLADAELVKTARSAWGYTERGENWFGARQVAVSHDELDVVFERSPDALLLLMFLRRRHWGRDFAIANALAAHMPGGRWTIKRLAGARRALLELGLIQELRVASRTQGAALYRFPAKSATNRDDGLIRQIDTAR